MTMLRRRDFLTAVTVSFLAERLHAQGAQRNTTFGPMNMDAYRPVKLPPKPNARPVLDADQRDALEHHLHCQCGCGLDIYTCRTTDFSCSVSPKMHLDVMGLVQEGYAANEIIAAFRKVYGDGVLMAPAKEGFNWLAYTLPFGALLAGGAVVAALIKRWSPAAASHAVAPVLPTTDATPEELERLRTALRSDE